MTSGLLQYLTRDGIVGIVAFQVVVLVIVFSNCLVLRRLNRCRSITAQPTVSVLVPARNEEANIRACLRSLLAQTYAQLEIIVLDDRSEDDTARILARERERDPRLRVLAGAEPPEGWNGKTWACHQLSHAAHGGVLLFADADTIFFEPDAVHRIARALQASRAGLLSGLPRQVLGTLGEKLLVPIFYWAFFSFTPLAAGLLWRRAPFTRAVGQLMAFQRQAYDAVGGHAAIRGSVVDDIDLARRITKAGLTCRIMDATEIVSCRMYRSGKEAYDGFGRNLFAAFGYAVLPYVFVWGWLGFAYLEPLVMAALHATLPTRVPAEPALLAATITLSLVHWVFVYARLRLPIWPALMYPLTIVAFVAVALRSLVDSVRRTTTWKGRSVARPPIRWV